MDTLEKRENIIKEINTIPDEFLDVLSDFLSQLKERSAEPLTISEKKYISYNDFEHTLKETLEKYKEVWKALA